MTLHRIWASKHPVVADRAALLGLALLALVTVACILEPLIGWISGTSATTQDLMSNYQPPLSPGHLFGTDQLGRDVLDRSFLAGQLSLAIGISVTATQLSLGIGFGLVAGYFGGLVDDLITAGVQILTTLPTFFVLVVLTVLFSPSVVGLVAVLSFLSWVGTFRIVRAMTLTAREAPYVEAARASGIGTGRLLLRHVLPNLTSPIAVQAGLGLGEAILAESGLSFLGLGVQPPAVSWGNVIGTSRDAASSAPWILLAPAALLFASVLGIHLVTDGIRDALDPRSFRHRVRYGVGMTHDQSGSTD